jgi:diguanylate cyclase (GGDEF)-like protein
MNLFFRKQIRLNPAIKNKRLNRQQCMIALLRLILAYLGVILSFLLLDNQSIGLLICLIIIASYGTLLFLNKTFSLYFTLNPILATIIDIILIFTLCYYSGGLNSPFLMAFLFPVLACAINPSFFKLLLPVIVSIVAILVLGLTGKFDSTMFCCITLTIIISGMMVYILVYNDIRILSSYVVQDGLTSLYTHQYFFDQLKILIEEQREPVMFSLIMIDLDDFKRLNDKYGHLEGDRVLKQVAQTIKANVRESDIVARYGGDEFGIILPGIGYELCSTIVERLRAAIVELGYFDHVSIGTALYPDEADELYELVNLADVRMYQEKRECRANIV